MPELRIDIDITGYLAEVPAAQNKDIPFVTAKALTRTAQDAQIEVRRDLAQKFTLRNDWTQRGIRITPAEKLSWPISAEIYTDTGNNRAPDYLEAQEDSALKVAHEGHQHIAIPTRILRGLLGASRIIPAALRPNELLANFTATHTSRVSKQQVRTPKSQQYEGFKQYMRGALYIFVRRPGDKHGEVLPFYLLVPEVQVRAVLGMEATTEKVAAERFEQHWDDAWSDLA